MSETHEKINPLEEASDGQTRDVSGDNVLSQDIAVF